MIKLLSSNTLRLKLSSSSSFNSIRIRQSHWEPYHWEEVWISTVSPLVPHSESRRWYPVSRLSPIHVVPRFKRVGSPRSSNNTIRPDHRNPRKQKPVTCDAGAGGGVAATEGGKAGEGEGEDEGEGKVVLRKPIYKLLVKPWTYEKVLQRIPKSQREFVWLWVLDVHAPESIVGWFSKAALATLRASREVESVERYTRKIPPLN